MSSLGLASRYLYSLLQRSASTLKTPTLLKPKTDCPIETPCDIERATKHISYQHAIIKSATSFSANFVRNMTAPRRAFHARWTETAPVTHHLGSSLHGTSLVKKMGLDISDEK